MVKKLGLLIFCVCLAPVLSFGQTLQAVVGVSTSNANICQDGPNNSTIKVTATVSGPACEYTDSTTGASGSGSGTATADYGVLQSTAAASETVGNNPLSAGSSTGTLFQDTLTFPNLSANATLQATLTVSVSDAVSGSGSVVVSADVYLNGNNNCIIQVVKGACTTSISVTPGSQVAVQGSFGVEAATGPGSGSSTFNADNKKTYGARFTFVLVDSATGRPLKVPIVSASGTNYPTK